MAPSLKHGLEDGNLGIGGVIRELGMETYRQVIAVGQTPARQSALSAAPDTVWRRYRLYHRGEVLMHIHEQFNLDVLG